MSGGLNLDFRHRQPRRPHDVRSQKPRIGPKRRQHRFDSGRRLLRNRPAVALAIALASCTATACGSTGSSPHASSRARATPAAHRRTTRAASAPGIGRAQRVHAGGTALSVAVTRVINPLVGSGAALQPGTRAVGVILRIQNHGPGDYDSSATGDVSMVPSSGTASPVFAPHGACQTPLRDFDNYITAGEIRHGCVAFSIAADAKVLKVRFSPHGRVAGGATWAAPG
jgi:hypothetical protein